MSRVAASAGQPAEGDIPPLEAAVDRGRTVSPVLAVAALLLLALNLRMGISSVGPVLPQVLHDLGAGVVFGSLLTTAPVIMMGLASPVSGRIAERIGFEWTVVGALAILSGATLVRLWAGSPAVLLLSALVLGIGIAAGNTMLPAIVRRYFPSRQALMTGLYTVGINVGAAGAALITPRIAQGVGPTWRPALAVWAATGIVAGLAWLVLARHARGRSRPAVGMSPTNRSAWLVALFFGLQSLVYYGVLAWLAPLYEEHGWSKPQAGLLLALFTASQIVGSMTAAVAVERTRRLVAGMRVTALATALGLFSVAITPLSVPWLWATILGVGAGGIFTLALTVPLAVTATVDEARRLTATTLCYGYLLAAAGPFLVSIMRNLSGGFASAFALLAAVSLVELGVARIVVRRQGMAVLAARKIEC